MESSKSTICKVDKRGGIFLPLSIRKAFNIAQNVRLEFLPQEEGTVVLRKLDSACFFCGEKGPLMNCTAFPSAKAAAIRLRHWMRKKRRNKEKAADGPSDWP